MTVPKSVAAMKMSARCISDKNWRKVLSLEAEANSTAPKSCTLSTKTGANFVDNVRSHLLKLA